MVLVTYLNQQVRDGIEKKAASVRGACLGFAAGMALVLVAVAPGCDRGRPSANEAAPAAASPTAAKHESGRTIRLSAEQAAAFGIEIGEAGPGRIETVIELPGEIRPDRDRVAHVRARFPGMVLEVRRHIGDHVKQGEVLARVESSQSLAAYPLRSLISGTVIGEGVARGDLASPSVDAFVVADLSVVWVDLSVYQPDLDHVRVGQSVLITTVQERPPVLGEISYVAPIVDERTRTGIARVVLPNPDHVWRPGLFVTGRVIVDVTEVPVVVPSQAVQNVGDETVVFVAGSSEFSPVPVEIGRRDRRGVEVISGLSSGDRFVSSGAFSLKSELEKEQFEAGMETEPCSSR